MSKIFRSTRSGIFNPISSSLKTARHRSLRFFGSSLPSAIPRELEAVMELKGASCRKRLVSLKQNYGESLLDKVTVKSALGGMRGTKLLLCETSQVDPVAGLSYRGIPLQTLADTMPRLEAGSQPPMEALLWLLLTGEMPSEHHINVLREDLLNRMSPPDHVMSVIDALPIDTHPMTQFIVGISACQTESLFSSNYRQATMKKNDYWKFTLNDGLTLIAQIPGIASQIYRRCFRPPNQQKVPSADPSLDWAANVAHLMGFEDPIVRDVFRLYVFLHADHEGGNVSAHAAHLVGSALADPFLSFTSAMCGLAGPLHGLANQEALVFLETMAAHFREAKMSISEENVRQYVQQEILDKGRVVPGFGHAVLRTTDPRFLLQRAFALKNMQDDELSNLLGVCHRVVPKVLLATGKVSNPFPNVDAHSGVILRYFGLTEEEFFTVLFGLSRSIGIVAQLAWDRLFNLPIERPKSMNLNSLEAHVATSAARMTPMTPGKPQPAQHL